MLPPISRYLIEHMSPDRRREFAAWNLDISVYLTPPSLVLVVVNPVAGMVVLMLVSFYTWTITSVDWLTTADVRKEVDKEDS